MIINSRRLAAVERERERERESYTLINKKINNINIYNQTGILCLYEDTG